MDIDKVKLQELVAEYKADFKENISVELYKWEAVKHFQDNWDLDAEDFATMLSRSLSKTANLLASMSNFPRKVIIQLAERFSKEVKSLFLELFDETKELKGRIDSFAVGIDELYSKWEDKDGKNHFHNLNVISTYLWLRSPSKYYIFKPSVAKRMFEGLRNENIKTNKSDAVIKTYELFDSISAVLCNDEELKGMFAATLTNNCYPDTLLKTATTDFAYFFSKSHIVKRHLLRKFLEVFPYENLSTMPIEQYTNLEKTSFCYWLEHETADLGSIAGATSFKFGIYRYNKSVVDSKKDYGFDEQYAWYKFYGENSSDVYKHVRDSIVQIATLAKEGKYEEIDEIDRLGTLVKWKIAFIYSNASLIPVFSREMLEYCAKKFGMENTEDATFAEMQRYLLNKKGDIEVFQWYDFYKVAEGYKKQGDLKSEKIITETNKNMYDTRYLPYINLFLKNRNLIFNGAPGTGKTYLAKQVAAQIIYEGNVPAGFEEDTKFIEQCGFVQFHPSYDYTDFVEGLRPKNDNGNIGFERKDGTFKSFCKKALTQRVFMPEEEALHLFKDELKVNNGVTLKSFRSETDIKVIVNEKENIAVQIASKWSCTDEHMLKYLRNKECHDNDTYTKTIGDYILENYVKKYSCSKMDSPQPYIFIIDEINRGEISKIFGELFFSIDPGYRGKKGKVQTQYQNLITGDDPFKDGFYIPENVYIIGTMNDIDRSVECMDFAMRRRFTFKEITAEESAKNMELSDGAKERMVGLNNAISEIEGLNSSFHIGAAYFKDEEDYKALWNLKLEGLLKEYLRGMPDAEESLETLRKAYYLDKE